MSRDDYSDIDPSEAHQLKNEHAKESIIRLENDNRNKMEAAEEKNFSRIFRLMIKERNRIFATQNQNNKGQPSKPEDTHGQRSKL